MAVSVSNYVVKKSIVEVTKSDELLDKLTYFQISRLVYFDLNHKFSGLNG